MSKKKIIALIFAIILIAFGIYTVSLSIKGPGDIEVCSGKLKIEEGAVDPDFHISINSPVLIRKVEMYQYIKEGEDVIEDFSDKKEGKFKVDEIEYENPKFPERLNSKIFTGKVIIGDSGLYLSDELLEKFTHENYINFKTQPKKFLVNGLKDKGEYLGLFPKDDYTYVSRDAYYNEIGDIRVTWYGVNPEQLASIYTVGGGVAGDIIGDSDHMKVIYDREISKDEVIEDFKTGNKWTGIGLIFFGIVILVFIFKPKKF